uniref:hypothetical protein n=1 Tax=Shigella sp. FC1967 TaxID=1898041 RepID=UPI00256FC107|nr:hypothetical protein [Shigella sp. FC1967]
MSKMTESDIETMTIEQLQALGYEYMYGPDIEPSGINPLRTYQQVILQQKSIRSDTTLKLAFNTR